jgi:hypothetical protein
MRKIVVVVLVVMVCFGFLQGMQVKAGTFVDWEFLKLNSCLDADEVSADRTKRLTFRFDPGDVCLRRTEDGIVYSLPGCSPSVAPEKPRFPIWKQSFPLQEMCKISYIRTIDVEGYLLDDSNAPIATSLEPLKYSQMEISYEKEKAVYAECIRKEQGDDSYNKSIVPSSVQTIYPHVNVMGDVSSFDQQTDLHVSVYPMYVLDGKVYLATKITVEIGLLDEKTPPNVDEKQNSSIIIAPDEFKEVAEELATIQQKAGFETEVVLLSFVENFQEAPYPKGLCWGYSEEYAFGFLKRYNYSLAAKIRSFLELRLKKDKVDYLTILGDATWIPPSFYFFANERYSWVDECVPSDFYYMAPFAAYETMNFEISVGRIPVQTMEDAINAVQKIESYRETVETSEEDWMTTFSMFSGDPFQGDYFGELNQCEVINAGLVNGLKIKKYFQTDDRFTAEHCLGELYSSENRILWISGHGSGDEIYFRDDSFGAQEVLQAPKHTKLPIVISESCLNGTWDSRMIDGDEKTPLLSFAESFFRSEGAGIAYIGGARSNYSYVDVQYDHGRPTLNHRTFSDSMIDYTLDSMIRNPEKTLGDSIKKALYQYYIKDIEKDRKGKFYTPDVKALFGYCLLGDPTLPCIDRDAKSECKIPSIEVPQGIFESPDFLPIVSIDSGVTMHVESDSPELEYRYCSYEDTADQLISEGMMEKVQGNEFSKAFADLVKTKGCLRFETEDDKEVRIVCYGKYQRDLRIEKTSGIQVLRIGENVRHTIQIFNDGIEETGNFSIRVLKNGEEIQEKTFRSLPFDCFMSYDFFIESDHAEVFQIEVASQLLTKKEVNLTDNQLYYDFSVKKEPFCRIGMLTSPYFRTDIGENYLHFTQLQEFFREEGNNVELHTVSYYFDENDKVSFNLLGFDALLLFDGIWWDYNPGIIKRELNAFVQQGGKVLGVCAVDENVVEDWWWIEQMQPFFGIKPDVRIHTKTSKEEQAEFRLLEKSSSFSKDVYAVHNFFNLCPHKDQKWEDWNEDHLLPNAKFIGTSEQVGLRYIQYGSNVFLYTGMFISHSFQECPDTYLLFKEMLLSMLEPTSSIGIEEVKRTDDHVLYTQGSTSVQIKVANRGNVTISNAVLACNGREITTITDFSGRSTITVPFTIVPTIPGENEYRFTISTSEDVLDSDNTFVFSCRAIEPFVTKEELFVAIEKKDIAPMEDSFVLEGKAFPGTHIQMKGQKNSAVIAVNQDGSFSTLITPEKEIEIIELVPFWNEIKGTPSEVKIHWMEPCQIYFQIGNATAFINGLPKRMDQSASVIKGRTMVPLSFIAVGFRASISWDAGNQSVHIQFLEKTVRMQIGNPVAIVEVDGKKTEVTLECPPMIINGRTVVPIRLLAEIFESQVEYDAATGAIHLEAIRSRNLLQIHESSLPEEHSDIFSYENHLNLTIFDFKNTPEGLFLATPSGIHIYKDFKKVDTIPYKKEWLGQNPDIYESFRWSRVDSPYHIRESDPSFLDVDEYCIVICLQSVIHVLNRETRQWMYSIEGVDYAQKLVPQERFERIDNVCLVGDYIYICKNWGHAIFDKYTGNCIGDYGRCIGMHQIDEYLIGLTYSSIVLYHLHNHQIRYVETPDDRYFTHIYVKNKETLTLFLDGGESFVEVPVKDLFKNDILRIRSKDVHMTYDIRSIIEIQNGKTPLLLQSDSVELKSKSNLWCVGLYSFNDNTYSVYGNCFRHEITEASKKNSLAPLSNYAYKVPGIERYILDYNRYYLSIRDMEEDTIYAFNKNRADGLFHSSSKITNIERGQFLNVVEYNDGFYCFRYDFSENVKKGNYRPHLDRIDIGEYENWVTHISLCDDYYCIYERREESVIFLDRKEGTLKRQCKLCPDDEFPFTYSKGVNRTDMVADGNTVYILDSCNNCIYTCNATTGFGEPIPLHNVIMDKGFSNVVADGDTLYLLHSPTSRIAILQNGILQTWLNPDDLDSAMIRSFDLCDGEILINDYLRGGVFFSSLRNWKH